VAYHNALELASRGHDVHVYTVGGQASVEHSPPGVSVHRRRALFAAGNAPFAPRLASELASFDLVHLHYPFFFGAEQVWWSHVRKAIPYVITYHQDVIFRGPLSVVERVYRHVAGSRILTGAGFVAATSLDYAGASHLAGIAPARLVEVPNGVDHQRFHPGIDSSALRGRYGLPHASPIVLFVATLDAAHYFKGLRVLLAALPLLPAATLVVVGGGDRRQAYESEARAAGLASRVRFVGPVSEAELPCHFALADVVSVPSITRGEAFGLVIVEAMATGKPVVASRLPGVRSVVDDGTTGLLAEPGDAADLAAKLRVALDDPILARRMGARGRQKVEERYDWRRIAARLERFYLEALDT